MSSPIDVSGLGNLFENGVANIKKVIDDNQGSLHCGRLKAIYTEDEILPLTPSVAILFQGFDNDLRSASDMVRRNYTFNLNYDIWYYHSELDKNVRRSEITSVLWQLVNMFMTNVMVNCFAPKLGCVVSGGTYRPRLRGGGVIMASAVFTLTIRVLWSIQNAQ